MENGKLTNRKILPRWVSGLWILGIVLLGVSCQDPHQEDDHDHESEEHAHEGEDHHEEDLATLEKLQKEIIGLKLGSFEEKVLNASIRMTGTLEIPPSNKAQVSSLMEGQVYQILVKPGQYIKKGARLATLRNQELIDLQQAYLEVEGSLLYLEKEEARQKELAAQEAVAEKNYEKVLSEYKIALARKEALRSKFQVLGLTLPSGEKALQTTFPIRSPISGYIKEIQVTLGSHVSTNQTLFEILDNHHIHIDLRAFEKDLPFLKLDQKLEFSLQSDPTKVYSARIFALGKALDQETRTATVHAEIEQEIPQLLPGMYVEARILGDAPKATRTLPESALVVDKGVEYIFVLDQDLEDESSYRKVQVLTGNRDVGYVEVRPLELLPDDAQIVTEGAFYLMAQTKKGEEGAGHHH